MYDVDIETPPPSIKYIAKNILVLLRRARSIELVFETTLDSLPVNSETSDASSVLELSKT